MTAEEVLSEIRERLVRVETKIDAMKDVKATAETAKETANEALEKSKSAHLRINEVADNQRWLWRTFVGGIIAAIITIFINLKGGSR